MFIKVAEIMIMLLNSLSPAQFINISHLLNNSIKVIQLVMRSKKLIKSDMLWWMKSKILPN